MSGNARAQLKALLLRKPPEPFFARGFLDTVEVLVVLLAVGFLVDFTEDFIILPFIHKDYHKQNAQAIVCHTQPMLYSNSKILVCCLEQL